MTAAFQVASHMGHMLPPLKSCSRLTAMMHKGTGCNSKRRLNINASISRGATPCLNASSSKMGKRRKDYFFKLLSAARNRDKRLLVSVLNSLGKDTEYLRTQARADVDSTDSLHIQDVLLKAASRCGLVKLADKLFKAMVAKGQYPTQHTAGAFLDALKLDGQANRCVAVFSEMMDVDVDVGTVCFNIVVSALVQDGNFEGAMSMLECASTQWGVNPDIYTFNIFFSAAAKQNNPSSRAAVRKAQQTMIQWGIAPDRVTINAQINYAIKDGRLEDAIETFEQALDGGFAGVVPDVITFNVGISAYMARSLDARAFELLDEMERRGLRPRADTFNSILTGLTKMGDTSRVVEVFNKYLTQDDASNGGNVAPSLVTYNLVLQALCVDNDKGQARLVDAEMRRRNIKPDNITLAALVRLQHSKDGVYDVISMARKLRIRPSLPFLNSCIRALASYGDVYGACQIMDRIKAMESVEPDTISYNSLMYAFVQDPWAAEVIRATHEMAGTQEVVTLGSFDETSSPDPGGVASTQELPLLPGSTASLDGLIGAEAALVLLSEMKVSGNGLRATPDIFTYTTVISGVVRAEDAWRSRGRGCKWWRQLDGGSVLEGREVLKSDASAVSSAELCQQLFMEAVEKGVGINGKICSAVMLGFGSDLAGAISFWRRYVRPALVPAFGGAATPGASTQQTRIVEDQRKDLFSAYCGLLHVCGRARRPDAAVKVVFALRKDGITPSSTLSNTYFKAKQDCEDLEDDRQRGRVPFRVMQLLDGQMENTLEVECGISKHSEPVNIPVERIRIRF